MRASLLAGLLAPALAAVAGAALGQSLIDPYAAQDRRELRSLENRAITAPGDAAAGARAARRALQDDIGRLGLSTERTRIDRQLGALGAAAEARARALEEAEPVPGPPLASPELPSSVTPETALLPSMRRQLAGVGGLLERSRERLEAGALDGARADFSLARRQLDVLRRLGALADDPAMQAAERQAADLDTRLAR
ncbi:MAG TPA: hypothetical protein VFG43_07800 [Geminicoccaceae bacterium]|nr:hypothetical protein [Geminicoccaceae bacterium]